MFDLEQAIAEWRKQMLAAGIQSPVPLDELESHLREEIERRMRDGFGEQIAFDIAVRQIGLASALNKEFTRIEMTNMKSIILKILGLSSMIAGIALVVPMLAILKQCRLNQEYIFDHHTGTVMLLLTGLLMVAFGIFTISRGFKTRNA